MVVVVADAIFEAGGRSVRLEAPDEALGDQKREGVVHGLERNGPDLVTDDVGNPIGGDVRVLPDRAHDGQPLGRHLNAVRAEAFGRVREHGSIVDQSLE